MTDVEHDDSSRSFHVVHIDDGAAEGRDESVAHEEPLEMQVNGVSLAVVMRTPGHDEELATGFALTEGVVAGVADLESVRHCTTVPDADAEDNVIQLRLRAGLAFDLEKHRRHMFASSSCGVCGKATIENACRAAPPLSGDRATIAASTLATLPASLHAAQAAFAATGGLHAAGLFTCDGALLVAREDVGRHNAVDKVVGWAARNAVAVDGLALLVSGRVSFELVQKAAAARIPILAGISAPTSLAVRLARALDVTVVGFLRGSSMNVYSADRRVRPA